MDRWPDDDGWDEEPSAAGPEPQEDWSELEALDFEDRYDPEELAVIEAGPSRPVNEPVTRVSQWRRRSALGAVLTGFALGLQEVFDPEEERSIVIEVDDDGLPTDLPVQMFLDPDSPAGSLCIVHRTGVKPPMV